MASEKWEYAMRTAGLTGGTTPKASSLWTETNKEGKSAFDGVAEYGESGWELVSVCPIIHTGLMPGQVFTDHLLFTFKRRVESGEE